MSRAFLSLTSALLLALSACATSEPTESSAPATEAAPAPAEPASGSAPMPTSGVGSDTGSVPAGCNAEAARRFVGQTASADVVEQARQAAGAESARTLKPGQMVTMEFNASRLNIDVDAKNMVTNVRCG